MVVRETIHAVHAALARQAAVALIGPRQIGKTTLAHTVGESMPSVYLDLESEDDRARLADPVLFLRGYGDRLVILDEIHRMPEIFPALRGVIDRGRRQGRRTGRFLILGSASIDLLRQSSESLAGRIGYVEMSPFSASEIADAGLDASALWVRGGFPDSYLAASDAGSIEWRRDFIRTYLERDIPLFGPRVPVQKMHRLWTMLAHEQGGMLNASELAKAILLSPQSVTRHVDVLVSRLVVRRLMPYQMNAGKRLVKSPKTYVRDSGLVHALLGLPDFNAISGHPVAGLSWEGFVIENLIAAAPPLTQASFYRTAVGAEIDLLLDIPAHGLWAFDIKRGLSSKPEKGFHIACEDVKPKRRFLVNAGTDRYPMSPVLEAMGVLEMTRVLKALGESKKAR